MFKLKQHLYYKNCECTITHILPSYKHGSNAYMVKFRQYRGYENISRLCYENELMEPMQISIFG